MKKVTIGILIVIPVIIMLVVSLVSVVVSANTHIGVESVTLDKSRIDDVPFGLDIYDINDYLTATVLPEKAKNKTCTWDIDEGSIKFDNSELQEEYENYLENPSDPSVKVVLAPVYLVDADGNRTDTNTTGKFKVTDSCSFVIVCNAEDKSATCQVFVTDVTLKAVAVQSEVSAIKESENALLSVLLNPVGAIVDRLEWISSDESVLTVDSNGVVVGKKEGSAEIVARAYVEGGYVESAPYVITVEKNASLLGNAVSTDVRRIPLSAFGIAENDIVNLVNASIEGDEIVIAEDKNEAQIETAYGVVTLTVEDGIVIKNKNLFAYVDGESSFVFAVGEKLNLEVVWKSVFKADKPQVTWSVDNDRIATVTDGVLEGKGNGIVTVTATCGDYSDVLTLNVREKAVSVIMDKTADEYTDAGLALEYVIPTLKYENIEANKNKVANYIDVELVRPAPPESEKAAFYEAFKFELLENGEVSDKGYFVSNRLYLNHEKVTEKTVLTVKVSAKYPKFPTSSLSRDNVEITVVNAVKATDFDTLKAATEEKINVCLVNNIEIDHSIRTDSPVLYNSAGYYGNGFMLSAEPGQLTNTHAALMICNADNSFVSNGIFRANRVVGDSISQDQTEGFQGSAIMFGTRGRTHGDYENGNYCYLSNTRAEYCIFENGNALCKVFTCETTLEGCILRNCAGVGIYVPTRTFGNDPDTMTVSYSKLTTKNCVMSNLVGMSLSFEYKDYALDANKEIIVEKRDALLAEGKNTFYKQEGFLDIYNWQSVNTMNLLPSDVFGSGDTDVALAQGINTLLRERLLDKKIEDYRYSYNREEFFLIGFMSTGVKYPTYLEWSFEDERLTFVTSDILSGLDIIANTVYLFTYKNTVEDIVPSSDYKINKKLINKLHGVG